MWPMELAFLIALHAAARLPMAMRLGGSQPTACDPSDCVRPMHQAGRRRAHGLTGQRRGARPEARQKARLIVPLSVRLLVRVSTNRECPLICGTSIFMCRHVPPVCPPPHPLLSRTRNVE